MSLNKLNQCFENGILPDELNFNTKNNNIELDWSKVAYNTFGRDENFIKDNIIPKALHKLPGIDLIIEDLKNNKLTPLEEIDIRQNIKISDTNNINE